MIESRELNLLSKGIGAAITGITRLRSVSMISILSRFFMAIKPSEHNGAEMELPSADQDV
jgi:hypothetical protein